MPKLLKRELICLDCETTGVDHHHGAAPFFVTVCREDGTQHWWEWPVDPFTRRPIVPVEDLQQISELIETCDLVGQNLKFDAHALTTLMPDLEWPWERCDDTLTAGHLLASNRRHDLTSMVLEAIGQDIEPVEKELEAATKKARSIARSKGFIEERGEWRIARDGLKEMPAYKTSSGKNANKDPKWKFDSWLPLALADELHYPTNHVWRTVLRDYANTDSLSTLVLWRWQKAKLEELGLWKIYKESLRVTPPTFAMERGGVTISVGRTSQLKTHYTKVVAELREQCLNAAGGDLEELPVNGMSNALRAVLFEKFGLISNKETKKGNVSADKYVLMDWALTLPKGEDPWLLVTGLQGYRKRKTALGYIDSYERFQVPWYDEDNCIDPDWAVLHPTLNLTGTVTLRGSMQNPNGQQIAKQEIEEEGQEQGHTARYMFGPAPGRELWSMDYENIELRIPAFKAFEPSMIELFERPDDPPYFGSYHLLNASLIYPDLFWPLANKKGAFKELYGATWYQWSKNFGFSVQYNAGRRTADAAARRAGSFDIVKAKLPKLEEYNQQCIAFANKRGYVETLPDKTVDPDRGYPLLCQRGDWGQIEATLPLNYVVQGTAMYCTRKAMCRCHDQMAVWNRKEGKGRYRMCLQVHDEIVFDFPKGGKANLPKAVRLKELMEMSGADINVPLKVAVKYHPDTWSDTKDIGESL